MDDKNLELIPENNQIVDYDRNPIEIEDYNSLFIFLLNISLIPIIIYIYIIQEDLMKIHYQET